MLLLNSCCNCPDKEKSKEADLFMNLGSEDSATVKTDHKKISFEDIHKITSNIHYGIDISRYQGNLMEDLSRRDSLRFIICKATQGISYVDDDFRDNWNGIKNKGFIRGAYHFYVCSEDPVQQAEHFASSIEDIEPTDISPIIDIEQGGMSDRITNEAMQKDLLTFLQKLEDRFNRKPILYTDYGFAQEYLKDSAFTKYDLWLAEYSKQPEPLIPELWKTRGLKIWQRSDTYNAYSTSIDLDVYRGQLIDLVR